MFVNYRCVSMFIIWISRSFSTTPARTSIATLKVPNTRNMGFATIALAQPHHTLAVVEAKWPDGTQSTVAPTCDIETLAHRTAPVGLREVARRRMQHRLAAHYSGRSLCQQF
jgi:hypothetical protein